MPKKQWKKLICGKIKFQQEQLDGAPHPTGISIHYYYQNWYNKYSIQVIIIQLENIQLLFIKSKNRQPWWNRSISAIFKWRTEANSFDINVERFHIFDFLPCVEGRNKLISFTSMIRGRERVCLVYWSWCHCRFYPHCCRMKDENVKCTHMLHCQSSHVQRSQAYESYRKSYHTWINSKNNITNSPYMDFTRMYSMRCKEQRAKSKKTKGKETTNNFLFLMFKVIKEFKKKTVRSFGKCCTIWRRMADGLSYNSYCAHSSNIFHMN